MLQEETRKSKEMFVQPRRLSTSGFRFDGRGTSSTSSRCRKDTDHSDWSYSREGRFEAARVAAACRSGHNLLSTTLRQRLESCRFRGPHTRGGAQWARWNRRSGRDHTDRQEGGAENVSAFGPRRSPAEANRVDPAEIGDGYAGRWIEDGYEYLFTFNLPDKPRKR